MKGSLGITSPHMFLKWENAAQEVLAPASKMQIDLSLRVLSSESPKDCLCVLTSAYTWVWATQSQDNLSGPGLVGSY